MHFYISTLIKFQNHLENGLIYCCTMSQKSVNDLNFYNLKIAEPIIALLLHNIPINLAYQSLLHHCGLVKICICIKDTLYSSYRNNFQVKVGTSEVLGGC